MTSKNYNNVFVEVAAYLKKNRVSEDSFYQAFEARKANDTARFPTDEDLASAIRLRPQYSWIPQNRLKLILEELEFAARDKFNVEGTLQDGLSIEHVMPQTWMSSWLLPSGRQAPADLMTGVDDSMRQEIEARKARIHSLPNLTLLTPPGNASASNAAFAQKKVRLNDSLLKMNVAIASEPSWDEEAILRRAERLTALALRLWPAPLPGDQAPADSAAGC